MTRTAHRVTIAAALSLAQFIVFLVIVEIRSSVAFDDSWGPPLVVGFLLAGPFVGMRLGRTLTGQRSNAPGYATLCLNVALILLDPATEGMSRPLIATILCAATFGVGFIGTYWTAPR